MANNDEYTDEYNDEYLCRDFFVGFNFWSRLSFQISEFRVHWEWGIYSWRVFVGSRACAANHYVIAEKCPYVMSSSAIVDFTEWLSITRSLPLSENVVRHTDW